MIPVLYHVNIKQRYASLWVSTSRANEANHVQYEGLSRSSIYGNFNLMPFILGIVRVPEAVPKNNDNVGSRRDTAVFIRVIF